MLIQRPVHQFFGLENCTVALIALARILRREINLKYWHEKYGTNWYPVVILGHVINLLMWLIGSFSRFFPDTIIFSCEKHKTYIGVIATPNSNIIKK